jgi:RimJ/RimL family protein N-acetyltransferase
MVKLQGEKIYLGTLEKDDYKTLREEFEYDFTNITDQLDIGQSLERTDEWFELITKEQGNSHIWLGVFLNDGTIVGNIHLHDIDKKNRSCYIGMKLSKIEYRNKGYGKEAVELLLEYGFNNYGMERISATTLETNISAQKSLEKSGFQLEGKERKAVYLAGKRLDKYRYGLLAEDYRKWNE